MCAIATSRTGTPRPSWSHLSGIVVAIAALGLGVDYIAAAGRMHLLLEALVVVGGFGGMLLWVRANRVALSLAEACDCAREHWRIRVVESRLATPAWLGQETEAPALVETSR